MTAEKMQLYLFYDGGCALCCRFADVVERWDVDGSIGVIDLAEAGIADQFPEIDLEAAVLELTVSEPGGQVFQGSLALQRLTRLLPGIRSLTWAYRLPGVVPALGRLYGAVNRRRKRLCLHCGEKWMPSMKYSRRKKGR
jgi:predicted DCC family thiol-disulfide oxidoreductase YuxK